jgi:hypothetical protein
MPSIDNAGLAEQRAAVERDYSRDGRTYDVGYDRSRPSMGASSSG